MKREGRQHGVVTCYELLPGSLSHQRFVNMVDSTGLFTKVSNKPTNHSKFTGKCRKPRCKRCHIHPVCKSKDKAKGTMKLRSIHEQNQLTKYAFGSSASGVLAYLAHDAGYDEEDDYDENDYDEDDHGHNLNDDALDIDLRVGFGIVTSEEHVYDVVVDDDDNDDNMSFCDVGLCWGHEDGDEYFGDDDWYLVGGQMQ